MRNPFMHLVYAVLAVSMIVTTGPQARAEYPDRVVKI